MNRDQLILNMVVDKLSNKNETRLAYIHDMVELAYIDERHTNTHMKQVFTTCRKSKSRNYYQFEFLVGQFIKVYTNEESFQSKGYHVQLSDYRDIDETITITSGDKSIDVTVDYRRINRPTLENCYKRLFFSRLDFWLSDEGLTIVVKKEIEKMLNLYDQLKTN